MPSLFRKTTIVYSTPEGRKCSKKDAVEADGCGQEKLRPGYKRTKERSKNYYGKYRDAAGVEHVEPLCPDKSASKEMLAKLVTDAKMGQLGLVDPHRKYKHIPLVCSECNSTSKNKKDQSCECGEGAHLSHYRRYLLAKDDGADHVQLTTRRIRGIIEGCKFERIDDITPGRVIEYLSRQRRLPKKTGGISTGTSNHYLRAIKGFTAWLVKDERARLDKLKFLSMLNAETDRRHERRSMPSAEFEWFLLTTQQSVRTFRGLGGMDRYMLYTVAGYTGLRCNELASLTPESFDLRGVPQTVTVEAGYSKRRRKDVLPLHPELATIIEGYLKSKPAGKKVWPGTWSMKASAKMLRADLTEGRKAWIVKAGDDAEERKKREESGFLSYRTSDGKVFDFHALRGQFISELARRGTHPKTAQQLARHSSINLTMNVYTHLGLMDLKKAVDNLPPPPNGNGKPKDHETPPRTDEKGQK